jgi:hypothetical protein
VRARCARTYSTAGISRDVRNVFGQSFAAWPRRFRTCPSRVISSNAAALAVAFPTPAGAAEEPAREEP